MFKTTKGWMAGMLISSAVIASLMILSSWLLRGSPYKEGTKDGIRMLWWVMFLYFVGTTPAGGCCWWRKKAS